MTLSSSQLRMNTEKKIRTILHKYKFKYFSPTLSPKLREILQKRKIAYLLVGKIKKKRNSKKLHLLCYIVSTYEKKKAIKLRLKKTEIKKLKEKLGSFLAKNIILQKKTTKKFVAPKVQKAKTSKEFSISQKQAFWLFFLLCTLIICIFSFSFYFLIRKGRILILPNFLQPILFCLLFYSIFTAFGNHHFQCDHPPKWYDWAQFTGAHILRAVDFLDFIEEYNLDLQNIQHRSTFSGIMIVAMHWIIDMFFLVGLVGFISKHLKFLKNWWDRWLSSLRKIALSALLIFIILYLATAFFQKWKILDTLVLWPLDNILRLLDVGDSFQIFSWCLHHMQENWWNAALAISFRVVAGFYIAIYVMALRVSLFKGFGMSVEDLIECLEEEKYMAHWDVAELLGKFGPQAAPAIPALKKALFAQQWLTRSHAAEALGKIGPSAKQAIPDLLKAITDEASCVHSSAKEALDKIDLRWYEMEETKQAIPNFIKGLNHEEWLVRSNIVEVLGKIGTCFEESIPLLVAALGDEEKGVRQQAKKSLDKINPRWYEVEEAKKAIPDLVGALAHEDYLAREEIKENLEKIEKSWHKSKGVERAIPRLIIALTQKDSDSREEAKQILDKIDPHWIQTKQSIEAIPELVKRLVAWDERTCSQAEELLHKIDPQWNKKTEIKEVVSDLIETLRNENLGETMQEIAAEALGKIGPLAVSAVPNLIEAMDEELICSSAIISLGKIGPDARQATIPLIKALVHDFREVREAAKKALDKIDPQWYKNKDCKRALPEIIKALAYSDKEDVAQEILQKINPEWKESEEGKDNLYALISALSEEERSVRDQARETLEEIDPHWQTSKAMQAAIPLLIKALVNKNPVVRDISAKTLPEIVPNWQQSKTAKEAIPDLVKALVSRNWLIRRKAQKTLQQIDPKWHQSKQAKESITDLIKALVSRKCLVRWSAKSALEKIEPSWAQSKEAQENMAYFIQKLASKPAEQILNKINSKWRWSKASQKTIPNLIKTLEESEFWSTRQEAAIALGKIGPRASKAITSLMSALKDHDWQVREASAKALEKIDSDWRRKFQ